MQAHEILHQCDRRVKTKGRKFWGLIPTFAEVTEENLVGGRGRGGGGFNFI